MEKLGYKSTLVNDPTLIVYIKCIVIARLALFIEKIFTPQLEPKQRELYDAIYIPYIQAILKLEGDITKIYLAQVLHASRGLLDNESTAFYSVDILNNIGVFAKQSVTRQKEFNEAVNFWKTTVLSSQLFFASLEEVIKVYSWQVNAKKLLEFLQDMEIKTVYGAIYFGMVGFNGIFITHRA
jgi:hypothetical protein